MKTHTILAIGAHVGDAELTAGALLATCAVHGGRAVTLALTAGEKGAPAGADVAQYRKNKIAEAEAFAKAVLERFANPYIHHRWQSIALNSISKYTVCCN